MSDPVRWIRFYKSRFPERSDTRQTDWSTTHMDDVCCAGPDEQSVYQHYLHCTTNYCNYLLSPKRWYIDISFIVWKSLSSIVATLLRRAEVAQTERTPCRTLDPESESYQCSAVMLIIKSSVGVTPRGESEESIAHRQSNMQTRDPPGSETQSSPKQGYQWPQLYFLINKL